MQQCHQQTEKMSQRPSAQLEQVSISIWSGANATFLYHHYTDLSFVWLIGLVGPLPSILASDQAEEHEDELIFCFANSSKLLCHQVSKESSWCIYPKWDFMVKFFIFWGTQVLKYFVFCSQVHTNMWRETTRTNNRHQNTNQRKGKCVLWYGGVFAKEKWVSTMFQLTIQLSLQKVRFCSHFFCVCFFRLYLNLVLGNVNVTLLSNQAKYVKHSALKTAADTDCLWIWFSSHHFPVLRSSL